MNVAELRTILEHVPDDLPVKLPRGVECWEVRLVRAAPWITAQLVLDEHMVGGIRFDKIGLRGRFRDRRTLDVRLDDITGAP